MNFEIKKTIKIFKKRFTIKFDKSWLAKIVSKMLGFNFDAINKKNTIIPNQLKNDQYLLN